MIIKLTTECPKNGFIIHQAHPETSAEMSHEGRVTQRAFATEKNILLVFLKTLALFFCLQIQNTWPAKLQTTEPRHPGRCPSRLLCT